MASTVADKALRNLGSGGGTAVTSDHVSACQQPTVTVVQKALQILGQVELESLTLPVSSEETFAPLAVTCPIGSPVVGDLFSVTLIATGGVEPYTWTVTGTLPTGLSLNRATGEISGVPTTFGTFNFTVHVASADGQTADSGGCELFVMGSGSVVVTSGCPIGPLTVGIPFADFTVTATGGNTPYTWSISAGALPDGLTLDSATGIISGTPTTQGSYSFTPHVHTVDGLDADVEGGCSIDVNGTLIGRPLTAVEFEDNPPVNPARSRILDGTNANDDDRPIGLSLTYAESQLDSCTSVLLGLASLMLYDFPAPPVAIDHVVVHVIDEYICGTNGGHDDGPFFAGCSVFWSNNQNPIGAGGMDNKYLDLSSHGGNVPAATAEHTVTISGADWRNASKFNNSASNLFVRCTQWDSGNFTFTAPSKLRIYDCWVEYFF